MKRSFFTVLAAALLMAGWGAGGLQAEEGIVAKELIAYLEVGEPVHHQNLTLIPIYAAAIKYGVRYATLEAALEKGWLKIEELDGGNVPRVQIRSKAQEMIFIMRGEILTGARQDRIVGRDLLLKPGSKKVIVPVYCVESGRWHYNSKEFYSNQNLGTFKLRSAAQEASAEAQSRIWDQISKTNSKMGVKSESDAYQDIYKNDVVEKKIAEAFRGMQDIPELYEDTLGVVVGVGKDIVSVDIFTNPYLFKKLWPKILKSSVLSAVLDSDAQGSITQDQAAEYLRSLYEKKYMRAPGLDLGFELSAADKSVNALLFGDAVIHLAAFPKREEEQRIQVMQEYSR